MARVWLPLKSKYWVACWRDSSGRQRRVTTRETNRYKALHIADAFERVTRERRTKLYVQRVIARLDEDLGGEPLSTSLEVPHETRQVHDKRFSNLERSRKDMASGTGHSSTLS
jgi:hypothetical protein